MKERKSNNVDGLRSEVVHLTRALEEMTKKSHVLEVDNFTLMSSNKSLLFEVTLLKDVP